MKVIKFRAWNPIEKKMYSSSDLIALNYTINPSSGYLNQKNEDQAGWVVMQFTGAIDKNGQEIYDSDYCKDLDGYSMVVSSTATFFMLKGLDGSRHYMLSEERMGLIEVAGNIYGNQS